MDLKDALGDWPGTNSQTAGATWPGQPNQPTWPGKPNQPTWPSQSGQSGWPAQPSQPGQSGWPAQPNQPTWPAQPSQPGQSGWPAQPAQPGQPAWPAQPGQPAQPNISPHSPQNSDAPHQKLHNGVYDKLLITINGAIKAQPDKFTVDMTTGDDIAFHFNPRFNDCGKKVIVRNSCISGKWGHEERELSNFPFVAGKPFEMKILCTNSEFKVAVNSSHLLTFQHRMSNLRQITNLHVYNDITLTNVKMETLP